MRRMLEVCSIAIAMACAVSGQAPAAHAVLFVLEQQPDGAFRLQPLFEMEKGRLRMPPALDPETNCRSFPPEYTREGKSYVLLFGGARAGAVRIAAGGKFAVSFNGRTPLSPALAADCSALGRATGSRHPPTAEERTAALSLARAQFRQKGVRETVLARFAAEQLISTDLNRDGAQDLIGAWRVDESPPGRSHSLFLVAERRGGAYRLSLVNYHSGMGETYGFEQPVDHLDLDGDGIDELITRKSGWEWYTYRVYSRRGQGWNRVYESPGCEGL